MLNCNPPGGICYFSAFLTIFFAIIRTGAFYLLALVAFLYAEWGIWDLKTGSDFLLFCVLNGCGFCCGESQ